MRPRSQRKGVSNYENEKKRHDDNFSTHFTLFIWHIFRFMAQSFAIRATAHNARMHVINKISAELNFTSNLNHLRQSKVMVHFECELSYAVEKRRDALLCSSLPRFDCVNLFFWPTQLSLW